MRSSRCLRTPARTLVVGVVTAVAAYGLPVAASAAGPTRTTPAATRAASAPASPVTATGVTRPRVSLPGLKVDPSGEVTSWRTPGSRTFVVGSDSGQHFRTVVTAEPGADSTQTPALAAGSDGWRTTGTATAGSLPRSAAGLVTLTAGSARVGFRLLGASAASTGTAAGDTVTWPSALPGVDLIMSARPAGVKETLRLTDRTAASTVRYALSVPAGWRPSARPDGSLALVDATGRPHGAVPAPVVDDATGPSPEGSRHASLTAAAAGGGGWTVTVSVDRAWLTDPARRFPVLVDPTTYLTDDGTNGHVTCQLGSGSEATTNECGGTSIAVGGTANRYRGLLSFPAVTSIVPPDALVDGATLTLHSVYAATSAAQTVEVHALTGGWTSGATWNTADGSAAWTSPGGDYDPGVQSAVSVPGNTSYGPVYLGLQPLVASWVSGSRPNLGMLIRSATEDGTQSTSFGSAAAASGQQPSLAVDWESRTGIANSNIYFTKSLTDRAQLSVNANGNLVLTSREYTLPAPSPALSISRVYNSLRSYTAGSLGYGWTLDTGHDVRATFGTDAAIHYLAPTGRRYRLVPDGTGHYTSPSLAADATLGAGNAVTITARKSGQKWSFRAGDGMLTTVTDRNGSSQTFAYSSTVFAGDNTPYLDSITDAAGRVFTVNRTYLTSGITDPTGRTTGYTYQNDADLIDAADTAGGHTTYSYDGNHRPTRITTPAGRVVTLCYDASSRVISLTQVTDTTNGTGPTTTFTYHAFTGTPGTGSTDVTDPNGHTTTYTYDTSDRITKVTDPLGHSRSTTYSPTGDVLTATNGMGVGQPAGSSITDTYDANGNLTTTQLPTGAVSRLSYAAPGQVYQPDSGVDAQGNTRARTYDGPGNVTSVKDATSGGTGATPLTYTYNPPAGSAPTCGGKPGQTCTSKDGNGNTTSYSYDGSGNLTKVAPPAPLGATTIVPDSLGRAAAVTDGKGQTTRYSYDALDRVLTVEYNGTTSCNPVDQTAGNCITDSYDADGNQTARTDHTGTTSYSYDSLSRQTAKTLPLTGGTISVSYDPVGNILTNNDSAGTTTYTYNADNTLATLGEPGGSCTSSPTSSCTTFGYDNTGRRTGTTYPGGTTQTTTLDTSGRPTEIKAVRGSSTLTDYRYTYANPASSNPNHDTELVQTRDDVLANHHQADSYDSLNRLTQVTETPIGGGTTTAAWNYCYDAAGNRTGANPTAGATSCTGGTSYGYNAANQLTSSNSNISGFSYDTVGNETSAAGVSARTGETYNPLNQYTATTIAGTTTGFGYAGNGNTERTSAGNTTFRTGLLGLEDATTTATTASYVRDPGGTLIAQHVNNTSSYYLVDGLGSTIKMVDATGAVTASYDYDPYGNLRSSSETIPNPYRYTGGYNDITTGLYKLGRRYYDPSLGRFTQQDPTNQETNLYAYTNDNPANETDLTGCAACDVFAYGLGLGLGAAGLFPPLALPAFVVGGIAAGVAVSGGCDEPTNQDFGVAEYGYGN